MKKYLSFFLLLCLPLSVFALWNDKVPVTVVRVIDGDTIEISMSWAIDTVRILWIDTPEKYTTRTGYVECYGDEASKYASDLLSGKTIEIEWDAKQKWRDIYNRLLAHVWVDGKLYWERAIKDGYSFRYTPKITKYQSIFINAEKEAKKSKLWVWGICNGKRTPLQVNSWSINTKTGAVVPKTVTTTKIIKTTLPKPSGSGNIVWSWSINTQYSCIKVPQYCSWVKTRAEAQYYLNTCHTTRFDRDNDGIACEDIK